jgi:hypothetical protein
MLRGQTLKLKLENKVNLIITYHKDGTIDFHPETDKEWDRLEDVGGTIELTNIHVWSKGRHVYEGPSSLIYIEPELVLYNPFENRYIKL